MEEFERFFQKVSPEPNSGCWLWIGAQTSGGYGCFKYQGRNHPSHRVSWSIFRGAIPPGLFLDHLCRTRSCCNPDHLEPVTQSENLKRSPLMGRFAHVTHCPQGHEYTAENSEFRKLNGWRRCRKCHNAKANLHRLKKRLNILCEEI